MPELITALAALAGVVGGGVAIYVRMRVDIAEIQANMRNLRDELKNLTSQIRHLETFLVAMLVKPDKPPEQRAAGT